MIESIKTALASWLRAEVFALVGEAMKGHDQDQTDMLNEIHALKREVAALREELADNSSPSAQQVAECISKSDLRKALSGVDLSEDIKEAVADHIDNMNLSEELGEAVENAIGNSALPQEQIDSAIGMCAQSIAESILENDSFKEVLVVAIGEKLAAER